MAWPRFSCTAGRALWWTLGRRLPLMQSQPRASISEESSRRDWELLGGFVCTSSEIAARGNQRPGKNYWHEYGHKHAGGAGIWSRPHGRRDSLVDEKGAW